MGNTLRCKHCDAGLWTQLSKTLGLCTECREGEYEGPVDAEDALEHGMDKAGL